MERQLLLELIGLQRQQLELMRSLAAPLREIAASSKPPAASPLLTQRKIYKQEAIKLLGMSDRTYNRYKASGLLKPRGIGHDFYYPEDLDRAMAESRRKGKV